MLTSCPPPLAAVRGLQVDGDPAREPELRPRGAGLGDGRVGHLEGAIVQALPEGEGLAHVGHRRLGIGAHGVARLHAVREEEAGQGLWIVPRVSLAVTPDVVRLASLDLPALESNWTISMRPYRSAPLAGFASGSIASNGRFRRCNTA